MKIMLLRDSGVTNLADTTGTDAEIKACLESNIGSMRDCDTLFCEFGDMDLDRKWLHDLCQTSGLVMVGGGIITDNPDFDNEAVAAIGKPMTGDSRDVVEAAQGELLETVLVTRMSSELGYEEILRMALDEPGEDSPTLH